MRKLIDEDPSGSLFWERYFTRDLTLIQRYALAIFLPGLSLFGIYLIQWIEGGTHITSVALLTVILIAIFGGRGPALLSGVLSSVGVEFFFGSHYSPIFDSVSSVLRILIYLLVGYLVASLVESLKRSYLSLREQKEVVEAEKVARENVLGIVSHDLRTPLASIMLNADMLLRFTGIEMGSSVYKQIANIKESSLRMNRIISDLLDAMKVDSGNFTVEKKAANIFHLLETAVIESRPLAETNKMRLELEADNKNLTIKCDDVRIIQVFNNLIGNAIKFSSVGGRVLITQKSTSREVTLVVKDYGKGISKQDQLHLFNRYWQSSDTAHKGTGLGLYISKRIIDLHGGTIKVESELGSGSQFTVTLPISDRST